MGNTRNQHFLPQLLLSGFASSTGKKQAWRFPRNGRPAQTNIRNIAAERDFHGRSGIEEKLAGDEGPQAGLLAELRAGRIPPGREDDCADFVSQMVVRTKNLREVLVRFHEDALESTNRCSGRTRSSMRS